MKTNGTLLRDAVLISAVVLGLSSATFAQSDSQKSTTPAKHAKTAPKTHKVWTEDDFGSVPQPATAAAQNQTGQADATQQTGAANQTSSSNHTQKGVPPPTLTNPKSLQEADKMIAWENRDIAAQEEFLDKLKEQISEAPDDQKDRLTKMLEQRKQILANTRNELKNLETKRKDLEKPPAGTQTASAEPPSN